MNYHNNSPVLIKLRGTAAQKPLLYFLTLIVLLAPFTSPVNAGEAAQSASTLEVGKPVERELGGGETHSYQIALTAGQLVRVVVDQRGINVVLSFYDPNEKKIVDLDSPVGALGPEPAGLIAEHPGTYRLEIRPWLPTSPKGRYEVKIEEIRVATPQDKVRIDAERAFAEASLISGRETGEARRQAIEKYEQVIPMWQAVPDPKQEAFTLTAIGYNHSRLGEHTKALDYYQRALKIRKNIGDRDGEGLLLFLIGNSNDWLGEPRKALEFYTQALSIQRATGKKAEEASTLGNIGAIYFGLGDYKKSLEFLVEALKLKREVRDVGGESTALNNIGMVHQHVGDLQKALEYYSLALPIIKAIGNRSSEGTTLNNIGTVYDELGETKKAIEFYTEVVEIKRIVGHRAEQAIALNNVGFGLIKLGENSKALEFLNRSLALAKEVGARSSESVTLGNLGRAYGNLGDHRKALDYLNQALEITISLGERRGQATTLVNIGRAYQDLGEPTKALEFHNQALSIRRAIADRNGESSALYNLARTQRDLNNLVAAREAIELAVAAFESLRINVKSPQLRATFLASMRRYYEFEIDILMRLHKQRPSEGFDAHALHASEKGRARSLLELLKEGRAEIRHGVDPSLIERERSLRQSIADKADRLSRLLSRQHPPQEAAAREKEIELLATEYEQLQGQIRQASPRYASLVQPLPVTLKEIQTELLDPDTLLLEYALGDEKSYVWAVTPTSRTSFELPKRQDIETAARELHETLSARTQNVVGETPEQRRQRLAQAETEWIKKASKLSEMILRPVAAELKGKRLIIVSEGALQYVPFSALPEPVLGSGGTATFKSLVVDHEIVSLPSASVLAVLRQEAVGRKPPSKTLAVLADPVFSPNDPRLIAAKQQAPVNDATSAEEDLKRSAAESGVGDLVRLRFTRLEAEEIAKLAPDKMKLMALDFAANRTVATSEELGQFRFVHFAAHGLINNQNPALSGIVLSLVDEKGQPQNGFLRLYDIYNLKLGADLVVLSACQTGLGKDIRGEGLIGLTRGFMYAGAPRVVATLWRVDDRASADLMRRFYAGMLRDGLRPAAALRLAQLSMMKEKRWQTPHYWAAFTLQGEWR